MCEPLVLRLLGTQLHELTLHQVRHYLQQIVRRSLRASYRPAALSLH
jgi:5-methylcytosine-specific restriction endonuclease McrBC regulatory subunit McrC